MKPRWERMEAGWYIYCRNSISGPDPLGIAVCREAQRDCPPGKCWCVYVDGDVPPGDSQYATLAEAKRRAERLYRRRLRP